MFVATVSKRNVTLKKTFTKKAPFLDPSLRFRHILQSPKPQERKNESDSPIPPKKS